MKVVHFTANMGGYDPEFNDVLNLNNYDLFRNNARNNRAVKLLAHKFIDCDISVYWDANQRSKVGYDAEPFVSLLGDADMCAQVNPKRKGVADEALQALVRVNDHQELEILRAQREHYLQNGLDTPNVYGYQPLIRRHTPRVNAFFEAWWAELCVRSYRDQISFPVILQQHDISVKHINLKDITYKTHSHGSRTYPIVK